MVLRFCFLFLFLLLGLNPRFAFSVDTRPSSPEEDEAVYFINSIGLRERAPTSMPYIA